jgi:hypothetical protein
VSVAVLALKSPKRHTYLDLFEKDKYSCCNSLKASSDIGRFTSRNASVVDYCITSPELLKLFFDFDILESSKLFSDVHAPLQILLSVNLNYKHTVSFTKI